MPGHRHAAPGPWQREYERDWQAYAQRAICAALGVGAMDSAPPVSPSDEHALRDLLRAVGVRPVSRKRAHSLTPQRAGHGRGVDAGADDSTLLVSDVSYVYRTPQGKEASASSESSVFPIFSSQDAELTANADHERTGSPMEVVASQRLIARTADLSPIAGDLAPVTASGMSTHLVAAPLGCGDVQQLLAEDDRSLLRDEVDSATTRDQTAPLMHHLDVSMQSMHLSDDERTVFQESVHLQGNEHEEAERDEHQQGASGSHETLRNRKCSISCAHEGDDKQPEVANNCRTYRVGGGTAPFVADAEPRVSKMLTFSDSDADSDTDVTVLDSNDQQQRNEEQRRANLRSESFGSASSAEPEPEFGMGFDNAETTTSPPVTGDQEPVSVQVEQVDETMESDQPERQQADSRASDDHGLEISDLTQPQARSRRRRRLSHRPRSTAKSITTTVGQQQQEAVQPQQVMRTKLPLQVEYRFTSDRKRRARRRRTFERTPGFPYQRPEYAVELQPYQNEAVEWMLDRERGCSPPSSEEAVAVTATTPDGRRRHRQDAKVAEMAGQIRGGILADEMGLGKTVCCVALICESLSMSREACRLESAASENPNIPRLRPPTLIVTPLSILTQWEHELRSRTNLSVVTYQGSTRKNVRTADDFMGVDVVLSTYDTLRLKECKVRPSSAARHFDSDDSDSEEDENMDAPWTETACAARTSGRPSSNTTPWILAARLTPSNSRRRPRGRGKAAASEVTSKLHQLAWHRVILDESHLITNALCARAQAACALQSSRRWCVTGTPVQNSSRDLASLVQFLGVSSDHLGDRSGDSDADATLRDLVPHIMLRRLKNSVDPRSRTPILALPEKTEETRTLEFATDVERALYLLLHRSTKRTVLQYLSVDARSRATSLSVRTTGAAPQFMHVFELLLRLRQTCDACALVTSDPRAEVEMRALGLQDRQGVDDLDAFSASESALLRSVCATSADEDRGGFPIGCEQLSTKVEALLTELREIKARGEKALVVSQWTSFLDLIAQRLDLHNTYAATQRAGEAAVTFDKLDGRLSSKERDVVVQRFQRERALDVLLLSLRTGGLGLNLTAASHVFIMEPSWNPSLETQAVDRAHRFGQRRPVRVVRFLMKGTIEERVVALQRKKQRLAAALLGDPSANGEGSAGGARLTKQDLRELFDTMSEREPR